MEVLEIDGYLAALGHGTFVRFEVCSLVIPELLSSSRVVIGGSTFSSHLLTMEEILLEEILLD